MTTTVPGKEDVFSRIVNAAKHYRPDREGMPPPFVDVMVDFDGTYDNPDNVCTDCFTSPGTNEYCMGILESAAKFGKSMEVKREKWR